MKYYSSGMYVRLGFAVAVHMKPDVLLIDEVLAVGDEEFQRKCFDHLYALRRSGRTIVVVSHGLGQLEGLCDEVAWLEHGVMQDHGQPVDVIGAYLKRVNAEEASRHPQIASYAGRRRRHGRRPRHQAEQRGDRQRRRRSHQPRGDGQDLRDPGRADDDPADPGAQRPHRPAARQRTARHHGEQPSKGVDFATIDGHRTAEFALVDNPLLPGRYRVHLDVFDYTGSKLLDTWTDAVEFSVRSQSGEFGQGFVQLPASIRLL